MEVIVKGRFQLVNDLSGLDFQLLFCNLIGC